MFAYAIYKVGAFLAMRLDLPTARRYAAAVGRFIGIFQRRNRRALYRNLKTAFGDQLSEREIRALRTRIYGNFGAFVLEFLWLPNVTAENVTDLITPLAVESYRRIRRLAEERGPVIFLTAHLGNWELAAVTGSLMDLPLTVLVDAHPSPLVTRFFDERREHKGLRLVSVSEFQKCFRALHQKRLLAIAGDRAVTGQGIRMEYFGRPALVPDGHAVLARRFHVPILPGFFVRSPDGRYDCVIDEIIEPRETDDFDADVRDCVERCLRVFERHVKEHPEQWYVFRPIWENLREDRLRLREQRIEARRVRIDARLKKMDVRRERMEEHRRRLVADREKLRETRSRLREDGEGDEDGR
jgi:Kdo2-lipid IVA lauroyltransferase/acyltransferase